MCFLVACSIPLRSDDLRDAEQLGADGQILRLHRRQVDLESDSVVFGDQSDHSATLGEAFDIAHGKNVPVSRDGNYLVQSSRFRTTNKQDVAGFDLCDLTKTLDDQWVIVAFLTLHDLVQRTTEGVIAENTYDQLRLGSGKSPRRPYDELGKVIKKGRFELILLRLCRNLWSCG